MLFNSLKVTDYTPRQGFKILLIFVLVEITIRPLLILTSKSFAITDSLWWLAVYVVTLTTLSYLLVTRLAKIDTRQIGFYEWKTWSLTEKYYFLQIIPITIIVFSFFTWTQLKVLYNRPNLIEICLFKLTPQIVWGLYQEFLYRGLLQTELVRRWRTWKGILISNLVFTFGPLHDYHFAIAERQPSHLWIFAAIFLVGLFFGLLFKRSGNLWIIGIMHGIGNVFLDGLTKI